MDESYFHLACTISDDPKLRKAYGYTSHKVGSDVKAICESILRSLGESRLEVIKAEAVHKARKGLPKGHIFYDVMPDTSRRAEEECLKFNLYISAPMELTLQPDFSEWLNQADVNELRRLYSRLKGNTVPV